MTFLIEAHLDLSLVLGGVPHDADAQTQAERHGNSHDRYQNGLVARVSVGRLRLSAHSTNAYATRTVACIFATLARLRKLLQGPEFFELSWVLAANTHCVA